MRAGHASLSAGRALLLGALLAVPSLVPRLVAAQTVADSLVALGLEAPDDDDAIAALRQALEQPGLQAAARAEILGYLFGPEDRTSALELPTHLWMLYWAGSTWDLLEYTLRAFENPVRWREPEQTELLKLLAVGLGARFYDPATFGASPIGSRIAALADEPGILVGAGIRELIRWYGPDPWGPTQRGSPATGCSESQLGDLRNRKPGVWDWWADSAPVEGPAMSREQAGRLLIRRLGNWYGEHGPDSAAVTESYLCVAAVVDTTSVMTSAFRDLVWTYIDADAVNPVQLLHRRFKSHFDESFDSAARGDKDYLRPLEEALGLGFHPFWTKWQFWTVVAVAPYPLCRWVLRFGFCGADKNATGTVIVTLPP